MKIALVSPYDYAYTGGVNIHISRLQENFTRMGHEVKIIAPSSKPQETQKNGDVIVFGRPVPIHASGSVVRSPVSPGLVFSSGIRDMLRRERFDVIHIHEPLMPTLATAVLHHASQELTVGTFHASRSRSWGYSFWKPICLNRWFNKLDGRIAVSSTAMEFVSRYFPSDYTIIPNGIDLPHFSRQVTPLERFCDGKLNILFVGRMEKRKGFKYLLGAYEKVKRELPQCRLIVVGPQDRSYEKYQRLAVKRNLKDVVFTGYVSYEELPRYYKSADIFCSPATCWESFGLVLLEAMAAGKPTVASDIAGYAAVVNDGVDGLLVKPRDEKALAGTILQLLQDGSLRERMGEMGKIKAGDYSWEKVAQQVMDYYQELLKGRSGVISEEISTASQGSAFLGSAR
ncbi:MAG: glycosyltransferase family 1 protein [Dehalococcoidia bacterium]|nr:MAG: glycosyltransferase family 1 protein [Dehalococcoidia bacterium]